MIAQIPWLSRMFVVPLVVFFALFFPGPAQSAAYGCRVDPIVFLSDGVQVQISATINTDATNVASIVYTLHVPPGVSMTLVRHTSGQLSSREIIDVRDDSSPGTYTTVTVVSTNTSPVPVTTRTSILNSTGSASGLSGDPLKVTLFIGYPQDVGKYANRGVR